MKKVIILLLLSFGVLASFAQAYSSFNMFNTNSITAIVCYMESPSGLFTSYYNRSCNDLPINSIKTYYAYDKKGQKLYVETAEGNYVIELKDRDFKYFKKKAPNLREKEISDVVSKVNKKLEDFFNAKNAQIQKRIDEQHAKEREERIKKERDDSLKRIKKQQAKDIYRSNHDFIHVPVRDCSLYCKYCKKNTDISDSIVCYGSTNDSIIWFDRLYGDLGIRYTHIHKAYIPSTLKDYEPYKYHYEIFKDSLNKRFNGLNPGELEYYNNKFFIEHMIEIKKISPNGYFVNWGWDSEYSNITFNFTYRNTNKKTIKYIEVFWRASNDVGDVRKTGSFKGTGPVEEWEAGSWSWDHSHYYVAGDTSKMRLTKVIITYMDGSRVVIPQAKIMEN